MTNNKGITLIALVITIIVLLILAGVSIAMLTGQNGILTQASTSKDKTAAAEVAERVNIELNAQLSHAMAGESFDTVEKIKANIGTLPTGYEITDAHVAINAGSSLSITVTGANASKLKTAVGTITKGSNGWSVTSSVEAK